MKDLSDGNNSVTICMYNELKVFVETFLRVYTFFNALKTHVSTTNQYLSCRLSEFNFNKHLVLVNTKKYFRYVVCK